MGTMIVQKLVTWHLRRSINSVYVNKALESIAVFCVTTCVSLKVDP